LVRDLFNSIPVRQASVAASGSTLAACRKVVEALALVHPNVRWTLWEDRPTGPRKVVALQGVSYFVRVELTLQGSSMLDMFRALYGSAGVEKVQKVHVSSGNRRVDGFISLEGAVTKVSSMKSHRS
jgi:DNA mismatch repair protein MLH3